MNALLVGCDFQEVKLDGCAIDFLGLCRPSILEAKAARPLYDYDIVVINPASYSHFLFGSKGKHSDSVDELWDLKRVDNNLDLDTVFDYRDRTVEMRAALEGGTRVIWLMALEKRIHFFGWRTIYMGYVHPEVQKIAQQAVVREKKTKRLTTRKDNNIFLQYFVELEKAGFDICLDNIDVGNDYLASSLEGYCLGVELKLKSSRGWLLTPPKTANTYAELLRCVSNSDLADQPGAYHGIFLSHTIEDKPFVQRLKKSLVAHGVREVWVDEAEIQIGDSLMKKIEAGIRSTRFFGVVLSPRSIQSKWVQRELEIAMHKEIGGEEVVVLPLLQERCKIPPFLQGKLYADFTTDEKYEESLNKLLRRLKK